MNTTPLAILLPVYNCESYLEEAINSVLTQSFENFHLFIYDDCSTDNSWELVKSYKDERIKIRRNQKNMGVGATLNLALNETLQYYPFIARMDGDDVCLPDRLERQINYLTKNVDIDLCGTQGYWQRDFSEINNSNLWHYPITHDEIRVNLLFSASFGHSSIMFKSKISKRANFKYDENYSSAEDWELWTRIIKEIRVSNLPDFLMKYRVVENSNHRNFLVKEQHWNQLSNLLSSYWTDFDVKIDKDLLIKFIRQSKLEDYEYQEVISQLSVLRIKIHKDWPTSSILLDKILTQKIVNIIVNEPFRRGFLMFWQFFNSKLDIPRHKLIISLIKKLYYL